jgi:hypothetical protein
MQYKCDPTFPDLYYEPLQPVQQTTLSNYASNPQSTNYSSQFTSLSPAPIQQQQFPVQTSSLPQAPPTISLQIPEFRPPNVQHLLKTMRHQVSNNDIESSLLALEARISNDTPVDLTFEQSISQYSVAKSRAFEKQLFANGNQELVDMLDSLFNMARHIRQQLNDVRQATYNNLSHTVAVINHDKRLDYKRNQDRRRKATQNRKPMENQDPTSPTSEQSEEQEQPEKPQHVSKRGKPASYTSLLKEKASKSNRQNLRT